VAKRRAEKPMPAESDACQMALGEQSPKKSAAKVLPPAKVTASAKRAVERRGVVAGRVAVRLAIKQSAAEALASRAIRETRNLEDLATEILDEGT
jgi:hypothetical protein